MTSPLRYFALLTHMGAQKLAQAAALGKPLSITDMAVGDGNGQLPAPDPAQTTLVNERRRGAINTLTTDKRNPDQLIAEQVIPETEGGFWIREIGLYDKDATLIAAGNCPETYKPQLQEGSGRTQIIRMVLVVSHTGAVTLKIDPSTVLATVEYVGDRIETLDNKLQQQLENYIPHSAKSDAVTSDSGDTVATSKAVKEVHDIAQQKYTAQDATTTQKGLTQLCSDTNSDDETQAATPKAVSTVMREAQSKQPAGNYALKDDSHSKQEALNLFLQKSKNGGDIPDKNAFVRNLGLSETVKQAQNAVPVTRTINGHSLKQNLTLTAGDIGAATPAQVADAKKAGTNAHHAASNANNNANGRVPNSRKVNSKPLTSDITLSAGDVGTYTRAEIDKKIISAGGKNTAGKGVNGWWKCGDTGLIIQWGIVTSGGTGTRNYPLNIPFPDKGAWALGQTYAAVSYGTDDASGSAALIDNKTIRVTLDNGLPTAWIAIGY